MMEIMLPDARYIPERGRGRLLELWAKRTQERRPGWVSIHEQKCVATETVVSSETTDVNADVCKDAETDSIDEAVLAEIANDMDIDAFDS